MTTEQKAKAYDEILEKARICQNHLYETGDKDYADELNYIFPELAESEDEKIRNSIISYLKSLRGRHEMFPYEWIDWLERQKYTGFKGCKVNLEEEISKYFGDDWKADTPTKVQQDMLDYAKHFFELGLKTQKEEKV